jgi:2-amino-4-hydroxy-6-hydroxymethyldihydropteridine diphosphokinase
MASSRRSTAQAKSSATTSPAETPTSTSSRTRSTSSITEVVIALGSNLGDRAYNLRRALSLLPVRVVRVSAFVETEPVGAPEGSPLFLNAVAIGYTSLDAFELLEELHAIEARMGRVRRRRNEPRVIDLDLILHGATAFRSRALTLPHPRAHERAFVMEPLREVLARAAGPLSAWRASR